MQPKAGGIFKIVPLNNKPDEISEQITGSKPSPSFRNFTWWGNDGDFFNRYLEFNSRDNRKAYREFIEENYQFYTYHIIFFGAIFAVLLTRIVNDRGHESYSNNDKSSIYLHEGALGVDIFTTVMISIYMVFQYLKRNGYTFNFFRSHHNYIKSDDCLLCLTVFAAGMNVISSAVYYKDAYRDQLELVIFIYTAPFILPIAFRRASKFGILFAWIISFGFLSVVEVMGFNHFFPYVTLIGEILIFLSIYEKERDRMLIFESYLVAHQKFGFAKENVKKIKVKLKRESLTRKLNDALVHEMLPRKVFKEFY